MMKKQLRLIAGAVICLSLNGANAFNLTPNLLFSTKMTGDEEVPRVNTPAIGLGGAILNATRDTLRLNFSMYGLTSPVTSAHFHEGKPRVSGDTVLGLTKFLKGNMLNGVVTGPRLTPELIAKFLKGVIYLNIHTTAHPAGEIRGQMILQQDWAFAAHLTNAQEVPAIEPTKGMGLGSFTLNKDMSTVHIYALTDSLSGPITAAHFHRAPRGVSGPPVIDLFSMVNGNVIAGEVPAALILQDLLLGNIYINIHTAARDKGEIRGQLTMQMGMAMDAKMNAAQEVPAPSTITDAKGITVARVTSNLDSLIYHVQTTGLTGPITMAHFHKGMVGKAGPPVIDITSSVMGNMIADTITGTALTPQLINDFLSGMMYVNIHTTANQTGEIRGQVYKFAREPFAFTLEGKQEVPMTPIPAIGSGIVSISRDTTNVHYMMLVNGLSGPVTMAHFHGGKIGVSGLPVLDISSSFMKSDSLDISEGYWKNTDPTPLTARIINGFFNDSIYVNVHTNSYPGGEVRGQVLKGAGPSSIITANVEELIYTESLSLSPNPANDKVRIRFNSMSPGQPNVTISDFTGRQMISNSVRITAGYNDVPLNVSDLSEGMYYISINNGNSKIVKKFIKR